MYMFSRHEFHLFVFVRSSLERIHRISATLRYRLLSGDSFESLIFFLQLLLAVVLDRRPACRRVPPLNHLTYPCNQYASSRFEHSNLVVCAKP